MYYDSSQEKHYKLIGISLLRSCGIFFRDCWLTWTYLWIPCLPWVVNVTFSTVKRTQSSQLVPQIGHFWYSLDLWRGRSVLGIWQGAILPLFERHEFNPRMVQDNFSVPLSFMYIFQCQGIKSNTMNMCVCTYVSCMYVLICIIHGGLSVKGIHLVCNDC